MDRRAALGLAILAMLLSGYLLLIKEPTLQLKNGSEVDLRERDLSRQIINIIPLWRAPVAQGQRFHLTLRGLDQHPQPALLLMPTCWQPGSATWINPSHSAAPLLIDTSHTTLTPLQGYISADGNQLLFDFDSVGAGTSPCLKVLVGTTEQLARHLTTRVIRELLPLGLLLGLLASLLARSFILKDYRDIGLNLSFTLCVLLFALGNSYVLTGELSLALGGPGLWYIKLMLAGLLGAVLAGIVFLPGELKNMARLPLPVKAGGLLISGLIAATLLMTEATRAWQYGPTLWLAIGINAAMFLHFRRQYARSVRMSYFLAINLLLSVVLLNLWLNFIDPQTLVFALVSLMIVTRVNLSLFPSQHQRLAPHEQQRLQAEIARTTTDLAAKNRALLLAQQELEEANAILKTLSLTDGLTGAYNRLYFDRQLLVEWQRARREQQCLSLILVDIDHFKAINDTYGHPAGDAGLKLVTAQLQDVFRRGNDFVCRYGGEEFAVLLPHTTPEQAAIHAENCRQAVAATPLMFNGESIAMTISIGIGGLIPSRDHEPLDLLHATDQMLYWVKRHGRNNLKIASEILADKITHPRADSEAH